MAAMRSFGYGTWPGLLAAGLCAIVLGLAFGRLEAWLHGRPKRVADAHDPAGLGDAIPAAVSPADAPSPALSTREDWTP
jgi:hypothetical protein